jgi:hypothetical protein
LARLTDSDQSQIEMGGGDSNVWEGGFIQWSNFWNGQPQRLAARKPSGNEPVITIMENTSSVSGLLISHGEKQIVSTLALTPNHKLFEARLYLVSRATFTQTTSLLIYGAFQFVE